MALREIQQHFQVCLCPSCVRSVCFLRKSTEFHDMRTECQRKIILIYFLLYSLFRSLLNHSCPNFLARRSLSTPSLASRSLAPQRSLPNCSLPPIDRLLPPTWSLVFYFPTCSLIDRSHQPFFGQTCSPIALYLPPTQSLVF